MLLLSKDVEWWVGMLRGVDEEVGMLFLMLYIEGSLIILLMQSEKIGRMTSLE